MLIVAVIGLVCNLIMAKVLHSGPGHSHSHGGGHAHGGPSGHSDYEGSKEEIMSPYGLSEDGDNPDDFKVKSN
jgi:Co/Zn/Cd efflux system component